MVMSSASTRAFSSTSAPERAPAAKATGAVVACSCGWVSRISRCRVHSPPLRTSLGTPGSGTIEPNFAPPPL
jgi:hypothetical protein